MFTAKTKRALLALAAAAALAAVRAPAPQDSRSAPAPLVPAGHHSPGDEGGAADPDG
jgi:hypothetical protein